MLLLFLAKPDTQHSCSLQPEQGKRGFGALPAPRAAAEVEGEGIITPTPLGSTLATVYFVRSYELMSVCGTWPNSTE